MRIALYCAALLCSLTVSVQGIAADFRVATFEVDASPGLVDRWPTTQRKRSQHH